MGMSVNTAYSSQAMAAVGRTAPGMPVPAPDAVAPPASAGAAPLAEPGRPLEPAPREGPAASPAIREQNADYSVEISLAAQIAEMRILGMDTAVIARWLGLDQAEVESYL